MAEGRILQRLIVLSRAAWVALAIVAVAVAVAVPTKHQVGAYQIANGLMEVALSMQAVGAPYFLCLIHAGRRPPGNLELVELAAMEWVLACFTFGTACVGLAVAHTFISRRACAPTACAIYMSVAIIACLVGALGWFSALATLWLVAPRFR